jgi:hypothetical protein
MNICRIRRIFLFLLPSLLLAVCARAGTAPLVNMDFPALVGDQGSIVHVDANGNASVTPIDFLQGEKIVNWDVATLNQVVTTDVGEVYAGTNQTINIKYYKNQKFARSFKLGKIAIIHWMMILPEKNCLILSTDNFGGFAGDTSSIIRIDLTSGAQKEMTNSGHYPIFVGKPLWDKTKKDLIIEVVRNTPTPGNPYPGNLSYSLARMDPDDFSIKDEKPLTDITVEGLVFYDDANNQIVYYGFSGRYQMEGSFNAFYSVSLNSGAPALIMKEETPGVFMNNAGTSFSYYHCGMAALANRYVLLTKADVVHGMRSTGSYCVDLKNLTWWPLSDITPFTWPIGQEGVHIDNSVAVPSLPPAATSSTTPTKSN